MAPLQVVKKRDYSECVICKTPLGADSKSEGFMLCHEHRKCSVCETELAITDAKWCLKRFEDKLEQEDYDNGPVNYSLMDLVHVSCATPPDPKQSVNQSTLDYLNLIRLMVEPDKDLSQIANENNAKIHCGRLLQTLDFEGKRLFQTRFEQILEYTQYIVRNDPEFKKDFLAKREKERFSKATKQETAPKPAEKTPDITAVQLEAFVELNGLDPKNIDENMKAMKLYWKTVERNVAKGIPQKLAEEMCKGFFKYLKKQEN